MALTIVPLRDLLAHDLADLVAESEQVGFRFLHRLLDEWAAGSNRFDRPGEVLFGATLDSRVIAVCGLNVDPYTSEARVGRVRHLYVLARYRRSGIGRRLVAEVIAAARPSFARLRLRTDTAEAARFYERPGFRPCVGLSNCTHTLEL
jgi:GNAT superfamily N-acetyltransferase